MSFRPAEFVNVLMQTNYPSILSECLNSVGTDHLKLYNCLGNSLNRLGESIASKKSINPEYFNSCLIELYKRTTEVTLNDVARSAFSISIPCPYPQAVCDSLRKQITDFTWFMVAAGDECSKNPERPSAMSKILIGVALIGVAFAVKKIGDCYFTPREKKNG